MYQTLNGGEAWHPLLLSKSNSGTPSIQSISFVDKLEGWVVGQEKQANEGKFRGIILHTTDGGNSWSTINIKDNESIYSVVHFADLKHGWIIDQKNVYRTNDRGKTWKTVLRLE
jgi:photosystem II stability/assembly factor-like uncharacterized protein